MPRLKKALKAKNIQNTFFDIEHVIGQPKVDKMRFIL